MYGDRKRPLNFYHDSYAHYLAHSKTVSPSISPLRSNSVEQLVICVTVNTGKRGAQLKLGYCVRINGINDHGYFVLNREIIMVIESGFTLLSAIFQQYHNGVF